MTVFFAINIPLTTRFFGPPLLPVARISKAEKRAAPPPEVWWLCCCFLILPLSCGLVFPPRAQFSIRAQVCAGVFSRHHAAQRGGGTGTEARPHTAQTSKWKKAPQLQGANSTQSSPFRLKGKEDFLSQHLPIRRGWVGFCGFFSTTASAKTCRSYVTLMVRVVLYSVSAPFGL